jgi:hypothetical protein
MGKIAGSGSGLISQRYGSADPDPYQNVTDPQDCGEEKHLYYYSLDMAATEGVHVYSRTEACCFILGIWASAVKGRIV